MLDAFFDDIAEVKPLDGRGLVCPHIDYERGGAVYINAGVTGASIKKSLFLNNMAVTGGAVENNGGVTIENVTFSHNLAMVSGGGAINNNGGILQTANCKLQIENCRL